MLDERSFIAQVESASPDEFRELLAAPSPEEERALRVHLGDERYQRMHIKAVRRARARGGPPRERGNVVVIHGVMGSELSVFDRSGDGDSLWVNLLRIARGRLDQLELAADGLSDSSPGSDIRVTGILKRYYGELLLSLSENWNVRAFWFDWRKDVNVAADELQAQLSGWFGDSAPVHIVAHSMGGLVARNFIGNHEKRWESMWDRGDARMKRAPGTLGGRLVMLGTPNHGSFAIPQAIFGLDDIIHKLALLDIRHSTNEILTILNSFVGSFQMLPSPFLLPEVEPLYDPDTYGELDILEHRLATARKQHQRLRSVVDPDRMLFVAGNNRPTFNSITNFEHLDRKDGYGLTWEGDGRVPHALGQLTAEDGRKVPMYFVDEDHGGLTENSRVLTALEDLLTTGATNQLATTSAMPRRRGAPSRTAQMAREERESNQTSDLEQLESLLERSRTWRTAASQGASRQRGTSTDDVESVSFASTDERRIEEILTRGILGSRDQAGPSAPAIPFDPVTIEIRVIGGGIEDVDKILGATDNPVDAIAVGHYLGGKPETAELALDQAISRAIGGKNGSSDLVISQLADRGTIRGELGQTFLLPDPRDTGTGPQRLIAVAGMGVPGRFGEPELAVVSRELCWALGRLGKRHLATVLIGAGKGNLNPGEAALAWMRGIKNAVTGSIDGKTERLRRITFIERDPEKIRAIQQAISDERQRLLDRQRLIVNFEPLSEDDLALVEKAWKTIRKRQDDDARHRLDDSPNSLPPTRLTATLDQGVYSFGALTAGASIPERQIPLDPALVKDANDELAGAWDIEKQYERGQFLGQLLLPSDFRPQLTTAAPLVLLLDTTTARVHWEMVAQNDDEFVPTALQSNGSEDRDERRRNQFEPRKFLGTSRGVTRQLRTTFAPPPQPPPPPRRVMRVLVVADPAADNRLPGAEAEGAAVAELFERFNTVHEQSDNRIEIVQLLGPQEATRTNVLRQLMLRTYDVLHFAGHCVYDHEHPDASGWIFSDQKRITAHELNRIDRVPGFIFSNACESGITPDRSEMRSVELAPSFAESFFKRGVSNFVCTAWPVDDVAAREFALTLYEHLLGLRAADENRRQFQPVPPEQMHVAMKEARLSIVDTPSGAQTWGAYQHYGNPYLRFFDPESMSQHATGKD